MPSLSCCALRHADDALDESIKGKERRWWGSRRSNWTMTAMCALICREMKAVLSATKREAFSLVRSVTTSLKNIILCIRNRQYSPLVPFLCSMLCYWYCQCTMCRRQIAIVTAVSEEEGSRVSYSYLQPDEIDGSSSQSTFHNQIPTGKQKEKCKLIAFSKSHISYFKSLIFPWQSQIV